MVSKLVLTHTVEDNEKNSYSKYLSAEKEFQSAVHKSMLY